MIDYDKCVEQTRGYGGSDGVVLPNGYLSFSSIEKLKTPRMWVEHYIYGNKQSIDGISYIAKGKEIAELRESDAIYQDKYPSLPVREKTLIVPIKLTFDGLYAPLLIKPDCMSADMSVLQDDKTQSIYSKKQWDRQRAYASMQFRLYSLAVYQLTGVIPQFRVLVMLMENEVETGLFNMYAVQYTERDMEDTREKFTKSVLQATQLMNIYR
jgi:hypothetical protein